MLKNIIIQRILKNGPISFETFMDMALYDLQYGYYMREETIIGRGGDFYTAPHLHRAFGAALMKQIEECWHYMKEPEEFVILEMGAGMGYLAKDILDYAKNKEIYRSLRYRIVELNHHIIKRQAEVLNGHIEKVKWYKSMDELMPFRGCLISNELLDSFPVHRVTVNNGIKEIHIDTDGRELFEIEVELQRDVIEYFKEFSINLPEGITTEVNLRIKSWLKTVSGLLTEGFIITVDYGYPAWQYYSEDYPQGTLQCYYRHQKTDNPYINIGFQDITSHVNFSSLKKWAEDLGLRNIGYTTQGRFIISIGIDEIIKELIKPEDYAFEVAGIKSLILPSGMGESHKVMIHYKGEGNPELRGFRLRNELSKL